KEVTETVFDDRSSDEEHSVANDRIKKGEGYHAVPPPLTGNYMPPKPDPSFAGLDDSIYKFKISETVTSLAKDEKDVPKTSTACVEKPKEDRSSAPDDDNVFTPEPIPAKIDFVKADRMAKKSVLPTNVGKGTGHRESRPVWNNVQRINHQNKFAPTVVFTRSSRIPVSIAKSKAAASTSNAKPVNTAGPKQSGHPQQALKNKGIVDSGFFRHMTGNKAYLADYQEIHNGGFVAFGLSRGKITCKGKIRTEKLDFDDVYFINELKFNLFSVLQMYDKKNSVLFTETECLVLSPNFKLLDESQVLLRVPRQSNMALVTKAHNKTPYELLNGRSPRLDFIRPFGCLVTILNTLDPLGKFEGKADEGFLVGYFVTSKAFRVFNTKTRKVEENLHVRFLENKPNVARTRPNWLFDIDSLINYMSYIPVSARNQNDNNVGPQDTNGNAGIKDNVDVGKEVYDQHYIVLPLWSSISSTYKSSDEKPVDDKPKDDTVQSVGAEADFNNMESSTIVSPIPTHKVDIDHPKDQILQEEGIDYDEVFALVARIEDIWIFLAFASFMGFIVYQMDV
nr:ribonuclease H-like domain-containing protein [Tanacetum cinerariifolium]